MGLPFDRTDDGKISQRRFGGHTNNVTQQPVMRACHSADRTGHMILQTLYQQCIKNGVTFYDEFQVIDSISGGDCAQGVVAVDIDGGEVHVFRSKAVLFATGGWGRVWQITSNAYSLTGDGPAVVLRCGLPLEDMEFFQFHPTGIHRMGILITEAVRGEGGILRNSEGERFMERYAPTILDLASRDVVSRAIYLEVQEGRGINGQDYVNLDATHLGREVVETKLPDIADFTRTYLGIDPAAQPMPVQPTAHYAMGGIPTNVDGCVIVDEKNTIMPGLYAAGECACVSVHGANRLGTNSLVDLIVFGLRAGRHMSKYVKEVDFDPLPPDPHARTQDALDQLLTGSGGESAANIRQELQKVMMDHVGVFRTAEGMQQALTKVRELQTRYSAVQIMDKGKRFNQELLEAWELGCLLDLAEVTAASALARQESRGAHSREDFPERDDEGWLRHTLAAKRDGEIDLRYKPVVINKHQPKARTY
jgi:succinate dehydrogenase / fumarate reductase flavoprotein subunit